MTLTEYEILANKYPILDETYAHLLFLKFCIEQRDEKFIGEASERFFEALNNAYDAVPKDSRCIFYLDDMNAEASLSLKTFLNSTGAESVPEFMVKLMVNNFEGSWIQALNSDDFTEVYSGYHEAQYWISKALKNITDPEKRDWILRAEIAMDIAYDSIP